MTRHTVIETPAGERLALVPLADYEALIARIEEIEEDAADVAAYDAAKAADEGGRRAIPPDEVRGGFLRYCRKRAGLTQSQLAEKTNLAQGYVSDLESGRRSPSADALDRIVKALGMAGDEFAALREGYGLSLGEAVELAALTEPALNEAAVDRIAKQAAARQG